MNRSFVLCFLLLICFDHVKAAALRPFDGPRPLVVMLETDPWLMVIGSDTPSFVLYEDGQVIWRKKSAKDGSAFLSKRLTPSELQKWTKTIKTLAAFRSGQTRIAMSNYSDQAETKFYIDLDGTKLVASVYGMHLAEGSRLKGRSGTPPQFELKKLFGFLQSTNFEGATPWAPDFIEAIAWNYDYAPDNAIVWPKHWPGLHAATTLKRTNVYSIFLPGTQRKELEAFLGTRKEKGAIEIDGKKFAVSYRLVFPSEPTWRKAFSELDTAASK